MEQKQGLMEDIVQRLSDLFQRNSPGEEVPSTDSAIETRSKGTEMDVGGGGAFAWYEDETASEGRRKAKYHEYERMDTESVEVASALDIYADNATSGEREKNETIEIVSDSERVIEILKEVKDRLNLDFELWSIAREMVKYGDCFEEVVVHPDNEVHRLKHLPPHNMKIQEDKWGRLASQYPYVQTNDSNETVAQLAEWQVLHFKLGKDRVSRYGVDGSMLYPLRKVFKQLSMIEDSLVIARLTRAQQRFAFMVDVTGVEPGDSTADYLRKVKNGMKKKRTIDPQTGKMDLKYNPLSVEEDIFLARREGGGSDVKVLQGANNLGQLEDVEYFSKKLFAGLKVPKAWMGFEGDTHARAVITELDVQFAKTVRRVQQALIDGLRDLFDFVLITRGFNPADHPYTLRLPIMSTVDELREWQLEELKAKVAAIYKHDLAIPSDWVYTTLLSMSEEELANLKDLKIAGDSFDNVEGEPASPDLEITEPEGTDATDEDEDNQLEGLSSREIRMMRHRLKEEIEALNMLTAWEKEQRTGQTTG